MGIFALVSPLLHLSLSLGGWFCGFFVFLLMNIFQNWCFRMATYGCSAFEITINYEPV